MSEIARIVQQQKQQKQGKGWKTGLGGTLIGLGTLGAAGNIDSGQLAEGIIGGSILAGLGSLLIALDRQKGKGYSAKGGLILKKNLFDKYFEKSLKNKLQSGRGLLKKDIKKFVKDNKNIQISAQDVFGSDWKEKGKLLIKQIKAQKGGNIFKDLGKAAKKSYKEIKQIRDKSVEKLKEWADGKTKFKPSDLLNYASGAVGVLGAASAFIPGVDLISVPTASATALGLKGAAQILKTSGRGLKGGEIDLDLLAQIGDATIIASVLGISVLAAKKLLNSLKKKGKGVKLAGSGVKLAGTGVSLAGGKKVEPGINFTSSGKIKRDRYSVFYGYYPKTASGLTKDDFVKKGNKIMSKKKIAQGKIAAKNLR